MDMREMVNKVKKGEPLYGTSKLSEHLQGVATRNSRYSQLFVHVLPWFNIVNHSQVSRLSKQTYLFLNIFSH
jgi:NADH-ubiquinone oxidoreductase subunit